MKLVSYLKDGNEQLAIHVDGFLYDTDRIHPELPSSMNIFLNYWEDYFPAALAIEHAIRNGQVGKERAVAEDQVELLSPVPFPASCRDGYAFRQHVEIARNNRGKDMLPEFDQFPVFYFSNHHAITGAGEIRCMPDHFDKLDFELEVAIVIAKTGRNIPAAEADEYIAGLVIMNDFSARQLQSEEMLLNLGPAKGKDFATALGPWLVTLDELETNEVPPQENHTGKNWNLAMKCRVNGVEVSSGNLQDMQWTFAEMIERASYGATLFSGDIIGSGTVGTGCFLELNGTGQRNNPGYTAQWLQEGDVVELEVEGLGVLRNSIVKEEAAFSIMANKK